MPLTCVGIGEARRASVHDDKTHNLLVLGVLGVLDLVAAAVAVCVAVVVAVAAAIAVAVVLLDNDLNALDCMSVGSLWRLGIKLDVARVLADVWRSRAAMPVDPDHSYHLHVARG